MSLASTPSELPLTGRRIVLGITGSIAAYKSAVLARELRRRGAEVRVVMTPGATEFITPLTLATLVDHPVHSDFTEDEHVNRARIDRFLHLMAESAHPVVQGIKRIQLWMLSLIHI